MNRVYFHNLDVLRFIAFFGVFISHIPLTAEFGFLSFLKGQGRLGVDFFFLISGFLITYLLLKEKNEKGRLDLVKFYLRRLLRIWPLYFVFMICIVALTYVFVDDFSLSRNTWLYTIFLGNFDRVWHGYETVRELPGFGVLWSISVEEQFYLFIPLLIAFIARKKILFLSILIIHIVSILFKVYIIVEYQNQHLAYQTLNFHSVSSFDLISFGCLLAYAGIYYPTLFRRLAVGISHVAIPLSMLLFLLLQLLIYKSGSAVLEWILGGEMLALIFSLPLIYICFGKVNTEKKDKLMNYLNYLGKISYGLYLFHFPAIVLCQYYMTNPMLISLGALFITILSASLSYNYFESYFLMVKKRFEIVRTRMD
ncbi:MAG: acyltransferase [Vicingaceae bacterium]